MSLRIGFFGTCDPAYARNRVLLAGLRAAGAEVLESCAPLPGSLDAARLATPGGAVRLACGLARAHLSLLRRHRRGVRLDVVLVGYPGHLMMPFGAVVARCRGALLVFDPLVSLFDTFAGDRALVAGGGAGGRAAGAADRAAFGLAGVVLADTKAHAEFFHGSLGVAWPRLVVTPVGAPPVAAATGGARTLAEGEPLVVLQYGKWSPLHGVETVLDAAATLAGEPFRFVLVGEGQMSAALRDGAARRRLTNVELVGQVPAADLPRRILAADVCLGVFGGSDKAARVIPTKVYDGLAAGRPVVTRDSPAVRELLVDGETALLVAAGDAGALAAALRALRSESERARLGTAGLALYRERCTPEIIGTGLLAALESRL